MSSKGKGWLVRAASVCGASGVVFVVALSSQPAGASRGRPVPAGSVASSLTKNFRVLDHAARRARAAAEQTIAPTLPRALVVSAPYIGGPGPNGPAWGLDLSEARYVVAAGGLGVWIIPGTRGVCIAYQQPWMQQGGVPAESVDCRSLSDANAGSLFGTNFAPPNPVPASNAVSSQLATAASVEVGFAPDTAGATVDAVSADGASESVPVTNNIYVVSGATPASISVRGADGTLNANAVSQ
jgi:hypothetical protein